MYTFHSLQGATATDLYKPFIAFALHTGVALAVFSAAKQMSHQQLLICGGFVLNISSLCGSSTNHNAVINSGWQAICSFMILAAMTVFASSLHSVFSISVEL
jgi:hypothetical protein